LRSQTFLEEKETEEGAKGLKSRLGDCLAELTRPPATTTFFWKVGCGGTPTPSTFSLIFTAASLAKRLCGLQMFSQSRKRVLSKLGYVVVSL
jgi:hypothetical protein